MREYQERYHARNRPSPTPLRQRRGALPPIGEVIADADGERIQCHICGEFYRGLNSHIRMSHSMSADWYRQTYGLARGQSLLSPQAQARQRELALAKQRAGLLKSQPPGANPRMAGIDMRLQSRVAASRNSAKRKQS